MKNLQKFNFQDLFVLDVANNHQGSVEHGTKIINECASVAKKYGVKAAMKFQFRDLPDFIHQDEQKNPTNKHVPRFISTLLNWGDFKKLVSVVKGQNLLAMCTPFDEASVEKIVELDFD